MQCFAIFADRESLILHQHISNHRKVPKRPCALTTQRRQPQRAPRTYVCEHVGCHRSFSSHKCLWVHRRIHTQARCEVCPVCDKSFTDPAARRKHVKYLHAAEASARPYVCKQCKKCFARKDSLQKHWLTHSKAQDRKVYACDECSASFTLKWNRQKHKRIYHG